jgi:hypothetical protein
MKPSFCALCARVTAELVQRQLGPREPFIWICLFCDSEPARKVVGPFHSYEAPELRSGSITRQAQAAVTRLGIPAMATELGRYSGKSASPGFVLVRVRRKRGNVPIDRDTARQTLRSEPWFAELRHIGTDARYHLFERPDVAAAAKARRAPRRDALAELRAAVERGGKR